MNYQIKYKRAISNPWKINPKPKRKFNQAIIIPSYAESNFICQTLLSIENNSKKILKETLVIIVINNSTIPDKLVYKNNLDTLNLLLKQKYTFTLGVIDAFTKGNELPIKQAGVGLARKIGTDLSLKYLRDYNSLIFSTDADTLVKNKYLETAIKYFKNLEIHAAVVGFKHQKSNDKRIDNVIKNYENFLYSTAKKIKKSGSPYGYVSMGSTMICTLNAYIAVGGMPNKKATEDFYFLQELTKYCGVHTINNILVHPSSRISNRIYLGTGFRIKQIQNGYDVKDLYFSENSYKILKKWLRLSFNSWKTKLNIFLESANTIHPNLEMFIKENKIELIWSKLQASSPSKNHFINQFNRWFDNLKTIRFLKYFSNLQI